MMKTTTKMWWTHYKIVCIYPCLESLPGGHVPLCPPGWIRPCALQTNSKMMQMLSWKKPSVSVTKHTSSVYAGLLLTEAIAEAIDLKKPLFAAYLDASKAFDVVWHDSMLRKLYLCGLQGKDWLLMKGYTNMESMVKWEGSLSKSFQEF